MDKYQFIIAEFHDGLQVIPSECNADKLSCIWPNHMKTKYRINKAILAREMPREKSDWEELPIKRIFGGANTYEESLQKLSLAQDTSNIDDTGMSSNDLREQNKKQRRIKAKKKILSSSSSEEDIYLKNKENKINIIQHKILPPFPDRGNFVNKVIEPIQNITNILREKNIIIPTNSNDRNNKQIATNNIKILQDSSENTEKDLSAYEFKKQIIGKLNKILYKLDGIEIKINMLEEKMQFSCHSYDGQDECDIHFPISTLTELISFEDQLQEIEFKDKVLNVLKLVGRVDGHAMIRNIMKKVITDTLAQNFNWTGKKNKRSFKD